MARELERAAITGMFGPLRCRTIPCDAMGRGCLETEGLVRSRKPGMDVVGDLETGTGSRRDRIIGGIGGDELQVRRISLLVLGWEVWGGEEVSVVSERCGHGTWVVGWREQMCSHRSCLI